MDDPRQHITLSIHLGVQLDGSDAAHRAGPSAADDTALQRLRNND